MRVIGISGSMRPASSTRRATELVLQGAADAGAEIILFDQSQVPMPVFDARDDETTYPPIVAEFRALAASADAFVLVSPEYHGSYTGALKNALDFLTWEQCAGKVFGLVGVSGGRMGANNTLNAMRTVCTWLQGWVLPLQVSCANRDFAPDGVVNDPEIEKRLVRMGRDLVIFASRISELPIQPPGGIVSSGSDADSDGK